MEWAHAIAPGAKIILVEANSQSLSDLMAGVATAANQPGVSVVSMSWGFAEGQAVLRPGRGPVRQLPDDPGRPSGRDLRGQHRRLRHGRSRIPGLFAQRGGGRRHQPLPQRRQLVQQRNGLGLLLQLRWARSSAAAAASASTRPSRRTSTACSPRATAPRRTCRFVADPDTGAWIADTVQPAGRQPVGDRGRHQPVGPVLGRPWSPWPTRASRDGGKHARLDRARPRRQQAAVQPAAERFHTTSPRGSNGGFTRGFRLRPGDRPGHARWPTCWSPTWPTTPGRSTPRQRRPPHLAGYVPSAPTGSTGSSGGQANFSVFSLETVSPLAASPARGAVRP